jgi:hypothetical protein
MLSAEAVRLRHRQLWNYFRRDSTGQIIVATQGSPSQRNLKDLILTEIESYETELEKMSTYPDTLTFVSSDVKITGYDSLVYTQTQLIKELIAPIFREILSLA